MSRFSKAVLLLVCIVAVGSAAGCTREQRGATAEPLPDRSKKLYSQNDEELVIRDVFDDRQGGVFVDVGSYHWRDLSTTYFLEQHLGWSGIAIDAQAGFADGYAKFRPKTKFFSYAITDKSGETLKLYLAFGASSLDPDWYKKFTKGKEQEMKAVDVPTITLNDLLEQNHVTKVDFLSMDIEGAEPAALAGFDIEKYRPDLVCIEAGEASRPVLLEYFGKHGYERIDEERDTVNWYFRPKKRWWFW